MTSRQIVTHHIHRFRSLRLVFDKLSSFLDMIYRDVNFNFSASLSVFTTGADNYTLPPSYTSSSETTRWTELDHRVNNLLVKKEVTTIKRRKLNYIGLWLSFLNFKICCLHNFNK